MVSTPEFKRISAVFIPETSEEPAPDVINESGLLLPEPDTFPARIILPVPALSTEGKLKVPVFVIPVFESPKVMLALVVATVPRMLKEEGSVTLRPPEKVTTSVSLFPKSRVPVLMNVLAPAMVLLLPVILIL